MQTLLFNLLTAVGILGFHTLKQYLDQSFRLYDEIDKSRQIHTLTRLKMKVYVTILLYCYFKNDYWVT